MLDFILYDGMLVPIGQSEVLIYLKCLADGPRIHFISFEKAEDWAKLAERKRIAQDIADADIVWYPLRYHNAFGVDHRRWALLAVLPDWSMRYLYGAR